ncbi:TPA: hypothetical protein ACW7NC_005090 [Klebsiella pneumoniae]
MIIAKKEKFKMQFVLTEETILDEQKNTFIFKYTECFLDLGVEFIHYKQKGVRVCTTETKEYTRQELRNIYDKEKQEMINFFMLEV